jgi:hypothetical protein
MSHYDPFRAPVAELGGPRAASTAEANAIVPSEIVELMRQTRPWVLFLAILGFIFSGLFCIGGVAFAVYSGRIGGKEGRTFPVAAGLVYFALGFIQIFPSLFMMRFSGAVSRLNAGVGMPALTDAIRHQKSFWRLVGIGTLAIMVIYVLVLAALDIGAMKGLHH